MDGEARDRSGDLLQTLRDVRIDVERIAATLRWLERKGTVTLGDCPRSAELIRRTLAARRLRPRFFAGCPADPGWSMLLELYLARLEGRHLAQGALFDLAGIAHTTGKRRLAILCQLGLVERTADSAHGRRLLVALTDEAARQMARYLAAALTLLPFIP